MKINNINIGARLAIAFGLVTLLAACLGLTAFCAFNTIDSRWRDFSGVTLQKRERVAQAEAGLGQAVHHFKNYLLRGADYDKKFGADLDAIAAAAGDYGAGALSAREQALLAEVARGVASYRGAMARAAELKAAGTAIEEIDRTVNGADKAIGQAIDGLSAIAREHTAAAGQSIADTVALGKRVMAALSAAVVLLSVLCAWRTTRAITRPMWQALGIAQTVAAGDLSSRIEVRSSDETGRLLQALKEMNGSLAGIVGDVRAGTEAIASAAGQIASGNQDLSSRTEQQAGALEETARSIEQLMLAVQSNARHADQANQMAISASAVAVRGGAAVAQVVGTMESINQSAQKISNIIGVIDAIAFQTNILALNAAVEAARAGEQGRGFAVVAAEVRGLAQRSASAAREIKELIGDSVGKVDAGSKLVHHAGATMEEIVASVQRVTDIMGGITAASREQEAGIGQINQAISAMDDVTQHNAALVEQAAAAAAALHDQAASLARVVAVFRLDPAPHGAPARGASLARRAVPARAVADGASFESVPDAPARVQGQRA